MLDIEQCCRRFSVATQIESIFAEAPNYKVRRKRSKMENNMTPTDAGACPLPIDLQPPRDHGLSLAQQDLGLDFDTLFEQGIALLSRAGPLLKSVLPLGDCGEADENLQDPLLVEEDIGDQRMRWKSNLLLHRFCWTLKGKRDQSNMC